MRKNLAPALVILVLVSIARFARRLSIWKSRCVTQSRLKTLVASARKTTRRSGCAGVTDEGWSREGCVFAVPCIWLYG
jgi:hypothetical protein